jgi:hypothetical protein
MRGRRREEAHETLVEGDHEKVGLSTPPIPARRERAFARSAHETEVRNDCYNDVAADATIFEYLTASNLSAAIYLPLEAIRMANGAHVLKQLQPISCLAAFKLIDEGLFLRLFSHVAPSYEFSLIVPENP